MSNESSGQGSAAEPAASGELVKLKIYRIDEKKTLSIMSEDKKTKVELEVPDFKAKGKNADKMLTAQFNPESFTLAIKAEPIQDKKKATSGTTVGESNQADAAAVTKSNSFSFKLIFDSSYNKSPDIANAVKFLNGLFYTTGKDTDQTRITSGVIIEYGQYINFQGTPTDLSLSYALFDTEGYPIRVVADLTISGENILDVKGKGKSDMASQAITTDGDSISKYTEKQLGKAALYTTVAAANKLPNLMKLVPGTKLKIPKVL